MNKKYNTLVLSGGGQKGISFIGVLQSLQENSNFNTNDIQFLAGSSIGGIICTAFCIKYNLQEIKNIFLSMNFLQLCPSLHDNKYEGKMIEQIFFSYSISDGKNMKNILCQLFTEKKINTNITFRELYHVSKKHLVLTGSNITNMIPEYFSYTKTPDMSVLTALLITTRLPYIFPPITINNALYIDGHLFDPFPIRGFSNKIIKKNRNHMIGIIITDVYKRYITGIKDYTFSIIEGLLHQNIKRTIHKYKKNVITINIEKNETIPTFNLSKEDMTSFYNLGIMEGNKFMQQ